MGVLRCSQTIRPAPRGPARLTLCSYRPAVPSKIIGGERPRSSCVGRSGFSDRPPPVQLLRGAPTRLSRRRRLLNPHDARDPETRKFVAPGMEGYHLPRFGRPRRATDTFCRLPAFSLGG